MNRLMLAYSEREEGECIANKVVKLLPSAPTKGQEAKSCCFADPPTVPHT